MRGSYLSSVGELALLEQQRAFLLFFFQTLSLSIGLSIDLLFEWLAHLISNHVIQELVQEASC